MRCDVEVAVVGAGPGGLAVAAELGRAGIPALVLDGASAVGSSWRGHYDRLHLHTVRWLSGLPGLPIPRSAGPWVSRADFVAYLETYARHHRLALRLGTAVEGLAREDGGWRLATSAGPLLARRVVVATGPNRVPLLPPWPGREGFSGLLLHASQYRSGAGFRGRSALVIGAGNSGAEIAVDLVEHGAARVWLAIRRPPNVLPRAVGGLVPAQLLALILGRLPRPLADGLARATQRLALGDLTRVGLPRPDRGVFTELIRDRQIPVLDVGLVAALRAGRVAIVRAVERFDGPEVRLAGGETLRPGVVVAATGYRPGLEPLVGRLGVLDAAGAPRVHGAAELPEAPGLHFVGFSTPPAGNLRELGLDARRLARWLAAASPPATNRDGRHPDVVTAER